MYKVKKNINKIKNQLRALWIIIVTLTIATITLYIKSNNNQKKIDELTIQISQEEDTTGNPQEQRLLSSHATSLLSSSDLKQLTRKEQIDTLLYFINKYDFAYPKIVLAQSILETGWFSSNVLDKNNNLFGMKVPYRRETTGIPSIDNDYLFFFTIEDCIIDRKIFERVFMSDLGEVEYLDYISDNYAEDPLYISKIKQISNNL